MYLFLDQSVVVPCALGSSALACYTDLQARRIPNWLCGTVLITGFCVQTRNHGWPGSLEALSGLLICGLVFLVFYLAGGTGAGDVKLIAAEGCLLGLHRSFALLLGTVLAGGLLAVVLAVRKRRFGQTLMNVASLVAHHRSMGLQPHREHNLANTSALRLPYALAIAAGVVFTLLVEHPMGWLQ